jgi:hypothetical protein
MALKFTGKFKNGDVIRGYDFQPMAGRGDCYIQGTVVDANDQSEGFLAYRINVEKRVFDDKVEFIDPKEEAQALIPHGVSIFEYDHRIIKV